ncbi:uncharacterized protein LOC123504919 [Portunus trituberculatus]|uniref:uncharacterized protein LOC123504919 n=1 Tax=Portunus trituberculatus TaxID=210409 RepID=UPI001E1CCEB1|nr:uncharacterized protein LOC123504919 [Portunus trituberculatus]
MCVCPPYTLTYCLSHTHTAMASRSALLLLLACLVHGSLSLQDAPICSTDDCSTNCENCGSGEKVADPVDCHSFYICDGQGGLLITQPLLCPPGTHFDPSQHDCVNGATCENCDRCFFECYDSKTGMVPHSTDCSVYYECNGNYPGHEQTCSATRPYFDGFRCQEHHNRCCSCHANCDSYHLNTLIPDPIDCRSYYFCDGPGKPSYRATCETGEYFDASVNTCSPNTECNTICKNFVNDNGCIDYYTCDSFGYFPKCPSLCQPEYYHCTEISNTYIESERCADDLVFHPMTHVCVKAEDCPSQAVPPAAP